MTSVTVAFDNKIRTVLHRKKVTKKFKKGGKSLSQIFQIQMIDNLNISKLTASTTMRSNSFPVLFLIMLKMGS